MSDFSSDSFDRLLKRTSVTRGESRPVGACLDAETLAAWIDDSLTATERAAAETHAADCDRCLAMLAAIVKTAPQPPAADRATWFPVRWLVPLTTAAVGVTAWMIIGEPRQLPSPSAPSAVDAAKVAESDQFKKADEERRDSAAVRQGDQATALQDKQTAPPALERSRDRFESRRAPEMDLKKKPSAPLDKPSVKAPARETEQSRTAASAPRAAVPAPPAAQRFEAAARDFAAGPRVIMSPDPKSQWRFTGSSVERSIDGGGTWRTQQTGATVDLLAASSPSASVCWTVGRAGTVLLSTDGETWRRLPFPEGSVDLVGVTAQDGMTATVTAANGRTYRTSDAGRTWTLQENPTTPF